MNKIYICNSDNYNSYSEITSFPNLNVIFKGDGNSIFISSTFKIKGRMKIICRDNQKILIKDHCRAESSEFHMQGNNNYLEIGEHTSIRNLRIIYGVENNLSCIIGNDCMFGTGCTIRVSDAHTIYDINSGEVLNLPSNIHIGNHVWIAQSVFITKNVQIPDNCVVGAYSVVTKQFKEKKHHTNNICLQ